MTTKLLTLSILLTLTTTPSFAQNAEKTLSKSFNPLGATKISLDLPGTVDLKIWDQSTIRIEVQVNAPALSQSTLNELANVGRYNINSELKGNNLFIVIPNLQKQVRIKGETLHEDLHFTVFIPQNLEVELVSGNVVALK